MGLAVDETAKHKGEPCSARRVGSGYGVPKEHLGNRSVYVLLSSRAGGLSVGVNLNPDRRCNYDCIYCDVDRRRPSADATLDVDAMALELERTLAEVQGGGLRHLAAYRNVPADLLQLRQVALSGDGEPTLCPRFREAVQAVVHVRARGPFPFFKIVLITNATTLDLERVQGGLRLLIHEDEVWAKLDAGTAAYHERVNRSQVPLEKVLANILWLGRQRPVVIQSLFPRLDGEEPPEEEIEAYAVRLRDLKAGGADIAMVQIYSASRPVLAARCMHLPLRSLSRIAQQVRSVTGLRVEVF